MTREAWFCPACQRHHAPHIDTCPAGGEGTVAKPWGPLDGIKPTKVRGGCDACRESGICGCVRPDRDWLTTSVYPVLFTNTKAFPQ